MASGTGTAVLDFGANNNAASVVLTGMTGITSAALIEPWVMPVDTTGLGNGHTEDEHALLAMLCAIWVPASSINAGAGTATLKAQCLAGVLAGKWKISYAWNG